VLARYVNIALILLPCFISKSACLDGYEILETAHLELLLFVMIITTSGSYDEG